MSLYGALFGGVSGLRAQSSKIGAISDNIANVNTVGYKQSTATFQTLVVNSTGGGTYQTGGVRGGTVMNISKQGLLTSTESATDLAISGAGFFVVRRSAEFTQGDTSATPYYTRAGSFTQDSLGNFRNTQGFYLQGWPLDREGRLPGEVGNLNQTSSSNFDSLETVNVESASGVAQATTVIELGANLKSSQTVYPGQAATLRPDVNTSNNQNLAADQILVGTDFGLDNGTSVNDVRRGDSFTITAGSTTGQPYIYGGYTIGRQVTSPGGSSNYGDFGTDNSALFNSNANTNVTLNVPGSIDITIPNHGLITGDQIQLTNFSNPIGATPIVQLNATHIITRVDANTVRITPATPHGVAVPSGVGADTFTADTRIFAGNILDSVTASGAFLAQTGTAGFSANALTFSITTPTGGVKVFKYTSNSPNTASGEFNSLTTLATAINQQVGLTARVVDGRMVVSAEDANESVVFANGDGVGNTTQRGIDWVGELDLKNIDDGDHRFNTLNGLAALVNADPDVSATVRNPLASSTLDINVDDPLSTIQFQDVNALPAAITAGSAVTFPDGPGTYAAGSSIRFQITDVPPGGVNVGDFINFADLPAGLGGLPGNAPNGGPWQVTAVVPGVSYEVTMTFPYDVTIGAGPFTSGAAGRAAVEGVSNHGSLLAQLGLVPSLNGTDYLTPAPLGGPQQTNVLGPQYDPSGTIGDNMASGDIVAQFSRNVRVYDALGSGHDVRFSYIKTAANTWAVEVHMIPPGDIVPQAGFVDGQIATGTVTFNGDGTLRSLSPSLQGAININWSNGSVPSAVTLDLGTAGEPFGTVGATVIGLSDGLSQFDSAYNVNFANQNGAPVGQLVSVSITEDGIVVASYSNGETQQLYKLPLADFPNPDGLGAQSGNIFTQTRESGEVNLREAGTNGTGTFVAAALEASNVDLAEQLTDMIVAQRAYQANTRVIKTTDELLEQLNQI